MRKWGVVITLFYALIIVTLAFPGLLLLVRDYSGWEDFRHQLLQTYAVWGAWIPVAILVCSQALLLFLRVDTSFKKLKPRAHILVSAAITAFFLALLTLAGVASLRVGFKGDNLGFLDRFSSEAVLGGRWEHASSYGCCGDSSSIVSRAAPATPSPAPFPGCSAAVCWSC